MAVQKLSAEDFKELHAQDESLFVIDVRTEAEFDGCHVKGARLFPLQNMTAEAVITAAEEAGSDTPIYVLCKAGGRAQKAAEAIAPETHRELIVVDGGTDACVLCDMPVNYGATSVMSLERQVRIAAGLLVFLGVVLGWMVAPAFYGLSAFVGAGLVFAGVTDTCAMGMLIARMPWNQSAKIKEA